MNMLTMNHLASYLELLLFFKKMSCSALSVAVNLPQEIQSFLAEMAEMLFLSTNC